MNRPTDALLWHALPPRQGREGLVRCEACVQACLLAPGQRGLCGVRLNEGGALRTLVGEVLISAHVDPIEKKPLYHYLPGSTTFSFGTEGCNLRCVFCQNADISQGPRLRGMVRGQHVQPEDIIRAACRADCASVAFTYNEPTVFIELMSRTAEAARAEGLGTVMVSNGLQSQAALRLLGPLIEAANIDLKSMRPDFYRKHCGGPLAPVLENIGHMLHMGWWVELTTLIIPGLNDSPDELRELATHIVTAYGPDVPWHISAFHPAFQLPTHPRTPPATLDLACRIGYEAGLRYIYPGNVPPESLRATRDTLCPHCGSLCLARPHVATQDFDGHCPSCGAALPGIWTRPQ